MQERSGVIVWVSDIKAARGLEKHGVIHYISKKMKYVVMYIDEEEYETTAVNLSKLPYVKQVERSFRKEIKTEYNTSVPDKTRFYTY